MTTARKPSVTNEGLTIAWFEQEMRTHPSQRGILDATSLGIWTICSQAGTLAELWKQHRILMQDLNTEQVTTALGELLGAIAQTAHAIDIPLATLMQQQVARIQQPGAVSVRPRKNAHAPTGQSAPPAPVPAVEESSVGKSRKKKTSAPTMKVQLPPRPARSNVVSPPLVPPTSLPDPHRLRRRRATAAASLGSPLVSVTTKQPNMNDAMQPTLLTEPPMKEIPHPKRKARIATK